MCPSVLQDRATGTDARTRPSTTASRDALEAIDNAVNLISFKVPEFDDHRR
jgi:hypothetical protein